MSTAGLALPIITSNLDDNRKIWISIGVVLLIAFGAYIYYKCSGWGFEYMDKLGFSPEQQGLLLETITRNEDTAKQRSVLGHRLSEKDPRYLLDEGSLEGLLVHNTKCSKSCCGNQWPVPFMKKDPFVCNGKVKYVPTNITCANEYSSGCACVPEKLWNFLVARGGNSYTNFVG